MGLGLVLFEVARFGRSYEVTWNRKGNTAAFCFCVLTAWQELDLLEDDAKVFKLIGPVLMKQDLEESKQNVAKRLELIEREM